MAPLVEGRPLAMLALARQLRAVGLDDHALELAARALALEPGDGEVRTLASEVLSNGVPDWHFGIVRDDLRNRAYEEALRRAVFPGCAVLEIGTGSGLLAMMAARAGAARVITCEADPAVAMTARAIIAANGLADRIVVLNKHSSAVDAAIDMGGRADILVSEIVSNDMISQGTLPSHEHAVPHLIKPGAAVIPARGRIRIALAEDKGGDRRRLTTVAGFDLALFNRLARPYREIAVENPQLTLRSAPADIFDFDFASGGPWPDRRGERTLVSSGGRINGIIQWIALAMDDLGLYENRPEPDAISCWAGIFWPFASPIDSLAGDEITIGARHETDRIRFWRVGH